MAIMGSSSNVNYSDLSNMIDEICQRYVHVYVINYLFIDYE